MRNYYADLTANTAIANVDWERRREERRRQEAERRARQIVQQNTNSETGRSRRNGNS